MEIDKGFVNNNEEVKAISAHSKKKPLTNMLNIILTVYTNNFINIKNSQEFLQFNTNNNKNKSKTKHFIK